jgi:uncharacterized membrane protein
VSESALMVVLRLIHFLAGVFWAGGAMVAAWFILPAQRAIGQPGMAFMQQLMFKQRLRVFVLGAMVLTLLSGLGMYARLSMTTHGAWASSRMGIVMSVGAVAAIIAGGIGGGVVSSIGKKMMAVVGAIQASGGTPTDAQRTEMQALQVRMMGAYRITAALLLVAIAAMASARYL